MNLPMINWEIFILISLSCDEYDGHPFMPPFVNFLLLWYNIIRDNSDPFEQFVVRYFLTG